MAQVADRLALYSPMGLFPATKKGILQPVLCRYLSMFEDKGDLIMTPTRVVLADVVKT